MINNRELIPKLFVGLKDEDLNQDIFYDNITFEYINAKFKILEIKESDEDFFDDFIILEEILEHFSEVELGFSCIVNYDNEIYVYEINANRSIDIFRVYPNAEPGGDIYYQLEGVASDKNYKLLKNKINSLKNLIFKKSKYRLTELLKDNNSNIDYIKF